MENGNERLPECELRQVDVQETSPTAKQFGTNFRLPVSSVLNRRLGEILSCFPVGSTISFCYFMTDLHSTRLEKVATTVLRHV